MLNTALVSQVRTYIMFTRGDRRDGAIVAAIGRGTIASCKQRIRVKPSVYLLELPTGRGLLFFLPYFTASGYGRPLHPSTRPTLDSYYDVLFAADILPPLNPDVANFQGQFFQGVRYPFSCLYHLLPLYVIHSVSSRLNSHAIHTPYLPRIKILSY